MQSPENSVVLSPSLGFCQMEISDKLAEQSVKVGLQLVAGGLFSYHLMSLTMTHA